jgi:hypothetical protein
MTTTRIILAGILGGIAMFIWTSLAHMALPLGEAGVRELPHEQALLASLKANLGEARGLYLFPGPGLGDNPTREAKKESMRRMSEKLASNPSGLLMYHPTRPLNFGRLLATEFVTELFEAILAVFLLAQTRIFSFGGRVGFVFVVGILAATATSVSYWNWYGFPKRYIAAYMFTQIVGFLCVGLVAALLMRSQKAEVPTS